MRLSQAGLDSFTDIGVDTQYQYLGDPHTVTVRGAWVHENHNTSASQVLGLANNSNDQLQSLNVSASYIYNSTWSLTAGRMSVGGTGDQALYGTPSGSPNSAGWRRLDHVLIAASSGHHLPTFSTVSGMKVIGHEGRYSPSPLSGCSCWVKRPSPGLCRRWAADFPSGRASSQSSLKTLSINSLQSRRQHVKGPVAIRGLRPARILLRRTGRKRPLRGHHRRRNRACGRRGHN
jgi:hypothetical protein